MLIISDLILSSEMFICLLAIASMNKWMNNGRAIGMLDFSPSMVRCQDFNPKLSDFDHAIDGPTGDMTHVETKVVGTCSYGAPEYVATGNLTTRCDVYNFGVVLLELITGLRALDAMLDWVRNNKKLLQIMDRRLDGQYPPEEAYKVARIGLQGASFDPKLRPRMNEVVAALEKL